jgi:hypothetical protein
MSFESVNIGAALGAIGVLGPASFALVDSLKILPNGGISNVGFASIERCLQAFFPNQTRRNATGGLKHLLDELHGNWISGRPLMDQKSMAKSLVELRLTGDTAAQFAQATDQDAVFLKVIGEKMASGARLEPAETNLLARFDLLLAAIIDDGYQHADHRYQNCTKFAAMMFSIVLGVLGGAAICTLDFSHYFGSSDMWLGVIVGFLATPLAPISKDLASALASLKIAQTLKR